MGVSFLHQQYRKIALGLGLFMIALIVFFGISITVSSGRYLDRFAAQNTRMIQVSIEAVKEEAADRVESWMVNDSLYRNLQNSQADYLDSFFSRQVKAAGVSEAHILLREKGAADYWYRGEFIPKTLMEDFQGAGLEAGSFYWSGDELWLMTSAQVDDYLILLAIPVNSENMENFLRVSDGNRLIDFSIARDKVEIKRDLGHWRRFGFSVPLNPNEDAYMTLVFEMDTLDEYFYRGYGVTTLLILVFFSWFMHVVIKGIMVKAGEQIVIFVEAVNQIARGEYHLKVGTTGYEEFDKLGCKVNDLAKTIEERNRDLSDHVQELYGLLIQVLEQKDPYTRGHSERVAKYARGIAEQLGLENHEEIHSAGLLHDIGKISIRELILNKPGRLAQEELEMIQTHAQKGYDLLSESKAFNRIRTWVLCHHERLDGSGYPQGLKGRETPFEARIIAVADVFDAMTSDRSYRKALTVRETLAHLHENEGTLYEKTIVDALETYLKTSS